MVLAFRLEKGGGVAPFRNRRAAYDRKKPLSGTCKSDYNDSIADMPQIVYHAEATSHQHILSSNLESRLVSICGAPLQLAIQLHISDETLALCAVKGAFWELRTSGVPSLRRGLK